MAGMYPGLHNVVTVDARPFNKRLERYPELICVPGDVSEVVAILREAKSQNKQVVARCGGHSYASYGLGGMDGAWVIDVQRFNKVEIDVEGQYAFIGAGNRLGRVALQLYDRARRAIPHGLCPRVGVAGHALHGGFGFSSRNWGLALDSIQAMHVILPDGRRIWTSEEVEPDLFWCLLGAGSSYGIVTEFKMRLQRAPEICVHYWYTWGEKGALPSKDNLIKIHHAFQEFAHQDTVPKELAVRFRILPDYLEVTGAYWGKMDDFLIAIKPLVDAWNAADVPPTNSLIKTKDGIRQDAKLGGSAAHERSWRDMLLYMANDDHLQQSERADMSSMSTHEYIEAYAMHSLDEALVKSYYPDSTPQINTGTREVRPAPALQMGNAPGASRSISVGTGQDNIPDPDFPELVRGAGAALQDEFLATSLCIEDRIDATNLFTYIKDQPTPKGYNWFLLMDVYGGKNSNITHGANRDNSCYSFRDNMFTFQFYINFDKTTKPNERESWETAIAYLHSMRDSVRRNTEPNFKVYMCYIDPEDRVAGQPDRPLPASYYYGASQYEKLKRLKEVYDPDHRFWNPQSIGAETLPTIPTQ